jgi:hypothetical protein
MRATSNGLYGKSVLPQIQVPMKGFRALVAWGSISDIVRVG